MATLYIIGTGPGAIEHLTEAARTALVASTVIVGYDNYIELIKPLVAGKEIVSTGMMREVERCREAIRRARSGETVSLVSGGDSGIYGMAGLVFELLEHESGMRDLAVEEEVEINMGESPDVQVAVVQESTTIDPAQARLLPLVPGVLTLRSTKVDAVTRVEISNARAAPIQFELRLQLHEGARVVRADHQLGTKNGRPIFRLTIPANEAVTVRYQTQRYQTRRTVG